MRHTFLYEQLCRERSGLEHYFSPELVDALYQQSFDACMTKSSMTASWQSTLRQIHQRPSAPLTYSPPYLHLPVHVPQKLYQAFIPWRKGPYSFESFTLDSEWNGSMKWERFEKHLDVRQKKILDVGSGNGYFSLLMGLHGAQSVVALEPFMLFNYQFHAIRSLANNTEQVHMFPLKLDDIQPSAGAFDIVLSMGVLYHHLSPLMHLQQLKRMLTSTGTLVLETLYIDAQKGGILTPKGRYAHMRNVWVIPSINTLIGWLETLGFTQILVLDINTTSSKEQRATQWLGDAPQSLADFVSGEYTLEGYPRPKRVMISAQLM